MITIGVAAAQLGVSTSTLRKWESRHGLPSPQRAPGGARSYSATEMERLRAIRRAMAGGLRPSQVLQQPSPAWPTATAAVPADAVGHPACVPTLAPNVGHALDLMRTHRFEDCRAWLLAQRHALPAQAFADDLMGPLAQAVGERWAAGELRVYEEHGATQVLRSVLEPPATAPRPGATTALLATLPGEQHTLGLGMLHWFLHDMGWRCINLGAAVPVDELALAAQDLGAHVAAVSLSMAVSGRAAQRQLNALRQLLPATVAVWVGGAGVARLPSVAAGVQVYRSCRDVQNALLTPDVSAVRVERI